LNDYFNERYKIISEIGEGGEGKIYKAEDLAVNRYVAIKELPLHRKNREEALKEARAIARISHPNVVSLYDIIEAENKIYLIMEYVEGATLREILNELHYLDFQAALGIFIQTALAVEFAHNHGILHLDIKPENILVSPEGRVKLTDFGIAQFISESPETDKIKGSTHYLAPEALKGHYSTASDVFALGVVLYEMLAGENPFFSYDPEESFRKILEYNPSLISSIRKDIPEEFDSILAKALAKQPGRRYKDVTRFRIKVERFFEYDYPEEPVKDLFEPEKKPRPSPAPKKALSFRRLTDKIFQAISLAAFAYLEGTAILGWKTPEPALSTIVVFVVSILSPALGAFLGFAFAAYFWLNASAMLALLSIFLGVLAFVSLRDFSKEGAYAGFAFPLLLLGMETAYLTHLYRKKKPKALIAGSLFYISGSLILSFAVMRKKAGFLNSFLGLKTASLSVWEIWIAFVVAPVLALLLTRLFNQILSSWLKFFSPVLSIFTIIVLGLFEANIKNDLTSLRLFYPERLALSLLGALLYSSLLLSRRKITSA
jgi:tRNA A-37 threonylcarbamoyl transferase component Bud32